MFLFYSFTVVRSLILDIKRQTHLTSPKVLVCHAAAPVVLRWAYIRAFSQRKLDFYLLLFTVSPLRFTPWRSFSIISPPSFLYAFLDILVWSLLCCPCLWHLCVTEAPGLAVQPNPGADTVPCWVMCWAQPQVSEIKIRIKLSLMWPGRGGPV